MREKDKLDLNKLNTMLKPSWRQWVPVGTKVTEAASGGLGAGGLAFSVIVAGLALLGITVATFFGAVATIAGAVVFGIPAFFLARHQARKVRLALGASQKALDEDVKNLRESLKLLFENYEALEQLKKEIEDKITQLNNAHPKDEDEAERINSEKKELEAAAKEINEAQENIYSRLTAVLDIFAGSKYTEKLASIFKMSTAQMEESAEHGLYMAPPIESVNKGFQKIWSKLSAQDQQNVKTTKEEHTDQLKDKIRIAAPKTPPHIKKMTYAFTGVGGFFSGTGLAIGIGITVALILTGSAATLLTGGAIIPILVAGGIGAFVAIKSLQKIDKEKMKVDKALDRGKTQLTQMKSYIDEDVNKATKKLIAKSKKSDREEQKVLEGMLLAHTNMFNKSQEKVKKVLETAHSYIAELKQFKQFKGEEEKVQELLTALNSHSASLELLKASIDEVGISASTEEQKLSLVKKVDGLLQQVKTDIADLQKVSKVKHEKLEHPLGELIHGKNKVVEQKVEKVAEEKVAEKSEESPKPGPVKGKDFP